MPKHMPRPVGMGMGAGTGGRPSHMPRPVRAPVPAPGSGAPTAKQRRAELLKLASHVKSSSATAAVLAATFDK